MRLIVGLGNPGKEYEKTRHNAGFMVAEKIISDAQLKTGKSPKTFSEIAKGKINGSDAVVAMPQTFMNESGRAVRALADFFKIQPGDIILVHDDKDIPLGEIKIQKNRGAAGHNGVQSVIDSLGTKNFTRIRVGIAAENLPGYDTADFVLGKFTKEETNLIKDATDKAAQEIIKMF